MTQVRSLICGTFAVAVGAWAGVVAATSHSVPTADGAPPTRRDQPSIVDRYGVPNGPLCEGYVPEQQLEQGESTLRFRLRGDNDGSPVEMKVRLWRLDVPENDEFTAGDEIRTTLVAPKDGAVVDRLPTGRYKLECLDRRRGREDPPEFTLTRGVTERDIAVPNRRWFRLRLLLVDEVGSPIVRSVRREGGSSASSSPEPGSDPPEWATPRRSRDTDSRTQSFVGYSAGDGTGGERTPVQATPDGFFDLGRHQEDSAWRRRWWSCSFLTDARDEVGVSMWNDAKWGVDTTFVGVAARIDVLVAHVTNPTGSRVDLETATIEAWCEAVQLPWTPPPDAWRTVPVHVKIAKPGCAPLEFDWTAATADAPHALVAGPPNSPK